MAARRSRVLKQTFEFRSYPFYVGKTRFDLFPGRKRRRNDDGVQTILTGVKVARVCGYIIDETTATITGRT